MARWTDLAEWRGPTPNQGGPMVEHRGLVLHIADGGYSGTIAWQQNPAAQVSSHFVVSTSGQIAQMVDTDVTAWTQRVGNGHWLSVECAGYSSGQLTDAQVEACAQLLLRGHQVYGYPLQLATSPSGMGLGHHSMGVESGVDWGHSQCPGPLIKAQKPAILARAIQLAQGDTMPDWDAKTARDIAYTLLDGGDPGVPMHVRVETLRNEVAALAGQIHALAEAVERLSAAHVPGEVAELTGELAPLVGRLSVIGTLDLAPVPTTA